MKAVVLESPGRLVEKDVTPPEAIGPRDALVRVRRVGVCGTDFHAYRGRQPLVTYPRILGHELGVEVAAVGTDVETVCPGDRAAVEPYLNCGRCSLCQSGRTNCCPALRVLGVHVDGGMRELLVLPAEKVHASAKLSFEQLALVETLSVSIHAVTRAGFGAGESVLVVGAGPIGLGVALHALRTGADVTIADTDEGRLRVADAALVKARVLQVRAGRGLSMRRSLGKRLPATVFDATGNRESMQESIQVVAPGGCVVLVGLTKGRISFEDAGFHARELRLLASRNATASDFRATIQLFEEGLIDTGAWFTNRSSWGAMIGEFSAWAGDSPPQMKAVLEF